MRTVVKWTPVALEEPQNYEARANLMWASSMALNTVLDAGTVHGCACHMMEHELSAYYDITHGHGLAILAPRWLEYILDDGTASAIYRLGIAVFGVEEGLSPEEGARRAIERVSSFAFETLGLEGTLTELGIDEAHFQDMARHACGGGRIPAQPGRGRRGAHLPHVPLGATRVPRGEVPMRGAKEAGSRGRAGKRASSRRYASFSASRVGRAPRLDQETPGRTIAPPVYPQMRIAISTGTYQDFAIAFGVGSARDDAAPRHIRARAFVRGSLSCGGPAAKRAGSLGEARVGVVASS